jgi:carbonic anhydrase
MRTLRRLFENNRVWARDRRARDPDFFRRLAGIQRPSYLWIGCADSRVPANEIVGLDPGEVFVHRNVGNLVHPEDPNCLSVLQYGLDTLRIGHVIVCGHYGCGGVQAALGPAQPDPLEGWLAPLRVLADAHAPQLEALADPVARARRLCELNVRAQVEAVCRLPVCHAAWERGQPLFIHGWIYDVGDGLLHDLELTVEEPPPLA